MYSLKLPASRSPRSCFRRLPRGRIVAISAAAASVALTVAAAAPAAAQSPEVTRGSVQDTFDDDLYLDPEGMDTRLSTLRQLTLALITEQRR